MQMCNALTPTDALLPVGSGAKFGKSRARVRLAQRLCCKSMIEQRPRAHFGHTNALLNPCVAFEH